MRIIAVTAGGAGNADVDWKASLREILNLRAGFSKIRFNSAS
jgi:hypothetical protein